jgi:hypothetical protein
MTSLLRVTFTKPKTLASLPSRTLLEIPDTALFCSILLSLDEAVDSRKQSADGL